MKITVNSLKMLLANGWSILQIGDANPQLIHPVKPPIDIPRDVYTQLFQTVGDKLHRNLT